MAEKKQQKKKQKSSADMWKSIVKVLLIVLVCLLVYWGTVSAYSFGYAVFNKEGMDEAPGKTVEIVVEQGASTLEVGELLEKKGLIESKWVFMAQKIFYGADIYPNTYEFNTSMNAQEMLTKLSVVPMAED